MTREVTGVVRDGRIELPRADRPPEGAAVRVLWDDAALTDAPYEREALTDDDVQADIEWARKRPFAKA